MYWNFRSVYALLYLLGILSFSAGASKGGGSRTKPLGLLMFRLVMSLLSKCCYDPLDGLAESSFLSTESCGMLMLGRR